MEICNNEMAKEKHALEMIGRKVACCTTPLKCLPTGDDSRNTFGRESCKSPRGSYWSTLLQKYFSGSGRSPSLPAREKGLLQEGGLNHLQEGFCGIGFRALAGNRWQEPQGAYQQNCDRFAFGNNFEGWLALGVTQRSSIWIPSYRYWPWTT